MDNRGKVWTQEDDQELMSHPEWPNARFSQLMGRSDNAIKYRRAHLAVKMHQQCGSDSCSLAQCAGLMGADMQQVESVLEQSRDKQNCFTAFLDQSRKRKSPFFSPPQAQAPESASAAVGFHERPLHERISAICRAIQAEEGCVWHLWNDPDMVPYLVQFQPGFDAFALFVQAQSSVFESAASEKKRA